MINDFCPKCRALTNMVLTTTESNEKDSEGKIIRLITTSYNCSMCHTFVKSENKRIALDSKEA